MSMHRLVARTTTPYRDTALRAVPALSTTFIVHHSIVIVVARLDRR